MTILRTCKRCGITYEGVEVEVFFRNPHKNRGDVRIHHQICRGCEQSRSDADKKKARARQKAENTRRDHCRKYNRRYGTSFTSGEYGKRFGWDINRMVHEIEHAYENGCQNCGENYREMGNGLSDVTIDIIDPTAEPAYGVNTRWICGTCNTEKQRTPISLLAAKQQAWLKWRKWHEAKSVDDYAGLPLFEGHYKKAKNGAIQYAFV